MLKSIYKMLLALKGYKIIGFKNNIVVGINIETGNYTFWTIDSVTKMLILFDSCSDRESAEFKYKIILN